MDVADCLSGCCDSAEYYDHKVGAAENSHFPVERTVLVAVVSTALTVVVVHVVDTFQMVVVNVVDTSQTVVRGAGESVIYLGF